MGKIPLDTQLLNNEIKYFGDSITIRSITRTLDDYGDASESTSDTDATAFVNVMTKEDEEVKEGTFQQGDKRFFIFTSSVVNRGDHIQHNNNWYEVEEVDEQTAINSTYYKEVVARKI